MSFFSRLFGGRRTETSAVSVSNPCDPFAVIARAQQEHAIELENALTPDVRQKIFATWRQNIDANAHDFADLILRYPDRDRIAQLEVTVFMQAYLNGYLAARGWIDSNLALQSAYRLGRHFRDEIRRLGLPLQAVSTNTGTAIDSALLEIVQLAQSAVAPAEADH
jgi:hypothetical protein